MSNMTQKWVNVLAPFSRNYYSKFSATELAKEMKIPQQTISRYLNKLVRSNLIEYVRKGRNKLFYFDFSKTTSKILINIIENQKALSFQIRLRKISLVVNEILDVCGSMIIFGSYAEGNFKNTSDLDILIFGKCNRKQVSKIKDKYVLEINEHYISYLEFDKSLSENKPLALEIMRNHVLFGDVSKIVDIFLNNKK